MSLPTDTTEAALEQAAVDPAAVIIDGNQVTSQPIPGLIALDKYLNAKAAAKKGSAWGRVKVAQDVSPGFGPPCRGGE